jgi:hypothetical protein
VPLPRGLIASDEDLGVTTPREAADADPRFSCEVSMQIRLK